MEGPNATQRHKDVVKIIDFVVTNVETVMFCLINGHRSGALRAK